MTAEELAASSARFENGQGQNCYLDGLSANDFNYGGPESQGQDQEPTAVLTTTPAHPTIAPNNLNALFQGAETTTDNDAFMANADGKDIGEVNEPTNTETDPTPNNSSSSSRQ